MDPSALLLSNDALDPSAFAFQPPPSVSPTVGRRGIALTPGRLSIDVIRDSGRESQKASQQKGIFKDSQERGLYTTNLGTYVPTTISGGFRVLSYNILAQRYASSDKYPECPPIALTEGYRSPLLAKEILRSASDVVALQEVSSEMFHHQSMLGALMRTEGYDGAHVTITSATGKDIGVAEDGMDDGFGGSFRGDIEGVAIFYKTSRFELIEGCNVEKYCLNEGPAADMTLTPAEKRKLLISSHNVALCSPLRCVLTRKCYLFTTLHAYWDTSRPEGQLYQLDQLLQKIHQTRTRIVAKEGEANVSVVLLGDFNCDLSMSPMKYLMHGGIDLDKYPEIQVISSWLNGTKGGSSLFSPTITQRLGRRASQKVELHHPFRFECAYAEYWCNQGHAGHVTAVNPSQGSVGSIIDHIFCETGKLAVLECGRLSTKKTFNGESIPNASYPSDHYPVIATLIPRDLLEGLSNDAVADLDGLLKALCESKEQKDTSGVDFCRPPHSEDDERPSWFLVAEESIKMGAGGF